jgi:arylsulfatase A-like enzyme
MAKNILDQRWPWLLAASLIVVAYLSTQLEPAPEPGADPRPAGDVEDIMALRDRDDLNILFILIDTLRSDRLSAYGYARQTSPALDQLAATGLLFRRHLSQSSWTKASMASMWTGLYPARTGVTRFDQVLPEDATMPAEVLREAGFRTVGIYRNGWVAPTFGFEQGFDVYTRPAPRPTSRAALVKNPTTHGRGSDEDVVSGGLEFLRIHGHERWFLYLHLMDLHEYTYDESSALFGSDYSGIYDNSIRWTDATLALLMSHLADQGYLENTLIVVTSDHGEAFRERGLEGHGRWVYKETTEVPFIVAFPFQLESGVVVNSRTRNVDIWPTVLDLVGLSLPGDLDGQSRLPEILAAARGEAAPAKDPIALAHLDQAWGQPTKEPQPTVSVVDGSLRYVRGDNRGRALEELFDASRDRAELEDISREDPETVARLRKIADEYLESKPPWGDAPTREIGELELNQLRALGYALP